MKTKTTLILIQVLILIIGINKQALAFPLTTFMSLAQNPEKEVIFTPPKKKVIATEPVQEAVAQQSTMAIVAASAETESKLSPLMIDYNSLQIPPNLYTGNLNVQIPIYTIQTKGIILPIALNYNGSGVQYKDKESVVGAGWNLSCDWKITRTAKGIPDEKRGLYETDIWRYDESPDLFQYSIPGYSGMFTFYSNANNGFSSVTNWWEGGDHWDAFFLMPYRDIFINWDDYHNFEIIDENGLIYKFGAYEYVIKESPSQCEYGGYLMLKREFIDVWYLTAIVDKTGEVLAEFKYEKQEYERKENFRVEHYNIYYQSNMKDMHSYGYYIREDRLSYEIYDYERMLSDMFDYLSWHSSNLPELGTMKEEYYKLKQYKLLLKAISWNEGQISFYNLPTTTEIGRSEKMSNIEVHSIGGNDGLIPIKKLKFIQSYFPSAAEQDLLRLDAIINIDIIDSTPVILFKFNYDQQIVPLEDISGNISLISDPFSYYGLNWFGEANILKSIESTQTGGAVFFEYYNDNNVLRIESITRHDGSGKTTTRYEYFGKQDYCESPRSYQIIGNYKNNDYYSKVVKLNYRLISQIRDMNGIAAGYSQVKEIHPNNSYTVYKFTNFSDHPDIIQPIGRFIGWGDAFRGPEVLTEMEFYPNNDELLPKHSLAHRRGLLTEIANYDAGGKLTSITKNSYNFKPISAFEPGREVIGDGIAKISLGQDSRGRDEPYTIKAQRFYISEPVRLSSTIMEGKNKPKTTTTYSYCEEAPTFVNEINISVENGDSYKTTITYPFNYGGTLVLANTETIGKSNYYMYHGDFKFNTPIEKIYYKNNSVIKGELNLFNAVKSTTTVKRVVPYTQGVLKLNAEIGKNGGFIKSNVGPGPDNPLSYDLRYEFDNFVEGYDVYGNPTWIKSSTGESKTIIYGYNNALPIAEIENAMPDQVFHTSFEEDGVVSGVAKTGDKVKNGAYTVNLSTLRNGTYVLSYFKRAAAENTFTRVVTPITVTDAIKTFAIGGAGIILDEVRVIPTMALMKTYTYKPLVGKTSETDANGATIYYEYDGFNRPSAVRDNEKNLLESVTYNL